MYTLNAASSGIDVLERGLEHGAAVGTYVVAVYGKVPRGRLFLSQRGVGGAVFAVADALSEDVVPIGVYACEVSIEGSYGLSRDGVGPEVGIGVGTLEDGVANGVEVDVVPVGPAACVHIDHAADTLTAGLAATTGIAVIQPVEHTVARGQRRHKQEQYVQLRLHVYADISLTGGCYLVKFCTLCVADARGIR